MDNYKIIDIHTHTFPSSIAEKATKNLGRFYNFYVACKGTYDDLEEEARQSGVCGFLLFCVATNKHQVENLNTSIAGLSILSRAHGFETTGFAGMHQDYPDFEGEINRCVSLGLRGVKLHPDIQGVDVDSPKLLPLYEILQKKGLKLFLHAGDDRAEYRFSEPRKIRKIADMFPRLPIVAAHLGGYSAWEDAERDLCGKCDNVWYDCSSSLWAMSPEKAKHMIEICGYDRVMFGTDYPVCHLKDYIGLFMKVDLNVTQREDIFYNNACRFLGL